MTLGDQIDHIETLKKERALAEAEVERVKHLINSAEVTLLESMSQQGLEQATGRLGRASISESTKPSVTNWEDFYNFIHENKYYHLLERRPHAAGCRELFSMRGAIPGVVPFVKRIVRVTKLS
jgi:sarcosine oxidase delta subunit